MWHLKQNYGLFGGNFETDSYERVEFQVRGSPHEHSFLRNENAPEFDVTNEESMERCVQMIDTFLTCKYDEPLHAIFKASSHSNVQQRKKKSK